MKGMKPDLCCCSRVCVLGTEMRISGTSVKPSLEDTPQRFSCKIGNESRLKTQPWGTPQIQHWRKRKQVFVLPFREKKVVSRRSEVAVKGRDLYPEMLFIPERGLTGVCAFCCRYLIHHDFPFGPPFLKKKSMKVADY